MKFINGEKYFIPKEDYEKFSELCEVVRIREKYSSSFRSERACTLIEKCGSFLEFKEFYGVWSYHSDAIVLFKQYNHYVQEEMEL